MQKLKQWAKKNREKIFDVIFLAVIVIAYSILAFLNLGDDVAPQTFHRAQANEYFTIVLPEEKRVSAVMIYTGETEADFTGKYSVLESGKTTYISGKEYAFEGSFKWTRIAINRKTSGIRITSSAGREISYGEIGVLDENEKLISGVTVQREIFAEENLETTMGELVDEQDTVVTHPTSMNTTYFDEVYFAQTAYEYANGLVGWETVHPPLGKILQSIPIAITGRMTPFTWRMGGTICGIIIVIVAYFLAKQIFKKSGYARFTAILVSLSGLHFTQTRIGTIDSWLCLFTMLSYLFMFKFVEGKKFRNFLLSGVFFGCAFATKWSGAFGGIGLAILFFKYLLDQGFWTTKTLRFREIFKNLFEKNVRKWTLRGFLCFILIPGTIYCSSYLLFPNTTNAHGLNDVSKQSLHLYRYHSHENTPHPYSSKWYTWPIALKPMLYALDRTEKTSISLMANYTIAYVSIIGLFISLYFGIKKKDASSTYILLAWLSLWLPYGLISRPMFLYHYLPASIFAILAVVNIFKQIPFIRKLIPYYIAAVLLSFIVCYPKMTGV